MATNNGKKSTATEPRTATDIFRAVLERNKRNVSPVPGGDLVNLFPLPIY